MEELNIFEITLSNVEGAYYAGQTVMGHCTVELSQPVTISGVDAQFTGEAKVKWTQFGYSEDDTRNHHSKSASELYFRSNQTLLQGSAYVSHSCMSGAVTLAEGRHTFPFSFPLPGDIPSSFKGEHADVSYSVRVSLRSPGKPDCRTKKSFTVIAVLDLNLNPEAEVPFEDGKEMMVCCCCCESGPIVAHFTLTRIGHIPGEPLQFRASVQNNSNQSIDYCSIYLKMVTTVSIQGEFFHSTNKMPLIETRRVEEGKSVTWTVSPESLVIPQFLPPSGFPGCSLIDVSYTVMLSIGQVCLSHMHLTMPLLIGTLPSRYAMSGDPPAPCRPFQATPQVGYPAVLPPGFETSGEPRSGTAVASDQWFASASDHQAAPGGRAQPSAPPLSSWGHVMPPEARGERSAGGLPEDFAGQSPPSYAECVEQDQRRDRLKQTHHGPPDANAV